jgi:hypothetical protein
MNIIIKFGEVERMGFEELFEEIMEGRVSKGLRKCVAYKTVMSKRLGKPVRRCAKFQPLK